MIIGKMDYLLNEREKGIGNQEFGVKN